MKFPRRNDGLEEIFKKVTFSQIPQKKESANRLCRMKRQSSG
ncbi:hypothetical protein ACFL2J_03525 [Candidatus Omnitrophota bacterium]